MRTPPFSHFVCTDMLLFETSNAKAYDKMVNVCQSKQQTNKGSKNHFGSVLCVKTTHYYVLCASIVLERRKSSCDILETWNRNNWKKKNTNSKKTMDLEFFVRQKKTCDKAQ